MAFVVASGTRSLLHAPISKFLAPTNGYLLYCDRVDKLVTIVPMPLYVSFGTKEGTLYGWDASTGYTEEVLTSTYKLHNISDNFTYYLHNGVYEYHMPSVLNFLAKHL